MSGVGKINPEDRYKAQSDIEVRQSEDKPKTVGKLNVQGYKLESVVETKVQHHIAVGEFVVVVHADAYCCQTDPDRPAAVGKLNRGWNPTSQIEVVKTEQVAPTGKLDVNALAPKLSTHESGPKKMSMEELIKADQRDN